MAIAIDSTSVSDTTSVSHTCTGAERLLIVGIETSNAGTANGADYVSAVTYNGVAMTRAVTGNTGDFRVYHYYLVAPATGANTISVTSTSAVTLIRNASYTGVKQGSQPDATGALVNTATPVTVPTTTVLDNCWIAGIFRASNPLTVDSGGVLRANSGSRALVDTNAAKTVGTHDIVVSNSSGGVAGMTMSFSPAITFTVAVTDTCTQTENALKRSRSYPVEIISLTQITIGSFAESIGLSEAYFSFKLGWRNLAKNAATFTNAVKNAATFTNLSKTVSTWSNQSKT